MNKKFINGLLLTSLLVGSAGTFTSCKDYDDDIDNLQQQIDGINVKLSELTEKINSGLLVKNVVSNADGGISISLSDGKTYNIGAKGEPGNSWTIGSDGYWYENGKKTDYIAIGQKGDKGDKGDKGENGSDGINGTNGTNGTNGANGVNGQNGKYYVPNVETGCFDIYQDGQFVESTTISWRPEATASSNSAVVSFFDGNSLKIVDPNNADNVAVISIGEAVGSIEFIPSVMSSALAYPTTDNQFLYTTDFLSEAKFNPTTKRFIVQRTLNKSNTVGFEYRINPSNAYVYEFAQAEFINRAVTSRAADDKGDLLNIVTTEVKEGENTNTKYFDCANGELTTVATLNGSALTGNDIVSFQLKNGQENWSTSDYVAITAKPIDVLLADSVKTVKNNAYWSFYDRNFAITDKESDAFVKQCVDFNWPENAELVYNDEKGLDLSTLVGLYSWGERDWISNLGFTGMSYKFSLPEEYLANDAQHTNQQWFVSLNGSVLSINKKNLTGSYTQAIGRTPVARVDAFLADNAGVEHMVASAYIKVKIVQAPTVDPEEQDPHEYNLAVKEFDYHKELNGDATLINQMDWREINNQIYGVTGLTSSNFWNNYGGSQKLFNVKITTTDKNDQSISLLSGSGYVGDTWYTPSNLGGIGMEVLFGDANTQTANIKFTLNNEIKTQNTYKNVDGRGAEYVITITIPANDNTVFGDVVIKQVFYVKEDCKPYNFNPNYYVASVGDVNDVVITKGKVVNGAWSLEMNISEVFEMIEGNNIFTYYNRVNNAAGIRFALDPTPQTGVSYTETANNGTIKLTAPLEKSQLFAPMKYNVTLVNGETCEFKFNILFKNPFVKGTANAISLNGNAIGAVTADVKPSLRVDDTNGNAIYSWSASANKLVLSNLATGSYKINDSMVSVTYAFVENEAYKTFKGNLDPSATFAINPTTGVVTYDNLGSTLVQNYNLTVKATVKFGNISVVTCEIPFNVKGQI